MLKNIAWVHRSKFTVLFNGEVKCSIGTLVIGFNSLWTQDTVYALHWTRGNYINV